MKMRIISTTVVLGVGLLGVTLAQQGDRGPTPNGAEELGAEVARLRAEVELLELEHQVNAGILTKLMNDVRNWDVLESGKVPMQEQLKILKRQVPAPPPVVPPLIPGNAGGEDIDTTSLVEEAIIKAVRPVRDRMRKEFVQEAIRLNETRLRLAKAERRYNEGK